MQERPFHQHQTFENASSLGYKGEYEHCTFVDCDLTKADLGGASFSHCTFKRCNLSNARLKGASFREVKFVDCKLLGLHWEDCNPIGLEWNAEGCALTYSSFARVRLRKLKLVNCDLREADLSGADLTDAVLDRCDLMSAAFDGTVLLRADLSTSHSYSIDPDKNVVRRARFSLPGVLGLLDRLDIEIV